MAHKLVSPDGVLHLVPAEKKAMSAFAHAHGLDNEYLKHHITGKRKPDGHKLWQLLDKVRWLQHGPTGAVLVVTGKPKPFFDARAEKCQRAGLAASAMPWTDCAKDLRQFERLMDGTLKSLDGWTLLDRAPPVIQEVVCNSMCSTCACPCSDLVTLLNPQVADEVLLLRQELHACQQQLAQNTSSYQSATAMTR